MSVQRDDVAATSEDVPIGDDRATVVVRTVRTRNGERLEIRSEDPADRIRIDPLALESLSWQDPAELAEALLPGAEEDAAAPPGSGARGRELCSFSLVNEFADVTVVGVREDGRAYVEIVAPKVGHRIRLTPSLLGAIAARDVGLFSEFLETPYGPEGEHGH